MQSQDKHLNSDYMDCPKSELIEIGHIGNIMRCI